MGSIRSTVLAFCHSHSSAIWCWLPDTHEDNALAVGQMFGQMARLHPVSKVLSCNMHRVSHSVSFSAERFQVSHPWVSF
jgi:hypothetical protein